MNTIYNDLGNEYWQLDYFFNGDLKLILLIKVVITHRMLSAIRIQNSISNTNVSRDWNYIYGRINNCNLVLNYVDKIPDTSLQTQRRNEMKAEEAAVMRAFIIFHAVQLWGDIPLVYQSGNRSNCRNFEEVYAQVYPARNPEWKFILYYC